MESLVVMEVVALAEIMIALGEMGHAIAFLNVIESLVDLVMNVAEYVATVMNVHVQTL
jgi:hypothetical protein